VLVSVVIPVRNGERHIAHQLEALSRQSYARSWELVVVDNGCTDRTLDVVEEWRDRLPAITIVDAAGRRGLNYARNRGAGAAHGELLAFCDADDVVSPGWLEALAAAALNADLVAGPLDVERLNGDLVRAWRPENSMTRLDLKHKLLPHAPGGNCAVWRDVALELGWDERFTFGSSDIEFSWRVQRAGYTLAFAENATVHLRFRESMWELARQYFRYGVSDAKLYRRFRREGMRRSSPREAARTWWGLVRTAGDLASTERRGRWLRVAGRSAGRAVGSVRWCVLFL
jgi:glycosyltransferase involved in cell wall biosynthesis